MQVYLFPFIGRYASKFVSISTFLLQSLINVY